MPAQLVRNKRSDTSAAIGATSDRFGGPPDRCGFFVATKCQTKCAPGVWQMGSRVSPQTGSRVSPGDLRLLRPGRSWVWAEAMGRIWLRGNGRAPEWFSADPVDRPALIPAINRLIDVTDRRLRERCPARGV